MSYLIVGDPRRFALETRVDRAFSRLSYCALGYFVVHMMGEVYGIREQDATLLGCSYDAICRRLERKGSHFGSFATGLLANEVANCFRMAYYEGSFSETKCLGLSPDQIVEEALKNDLIFAPDGDEAFDDGSNILQFDLESEVRLVAFKNCPSENISIGSISEIYMPIDEFYEILTFWRDDFETMRQRLLNTQE